jgi:ubiquinol-cytochrome c reductase iron-sulfur subunit
MLALFFGGLGISLVGWARWLTIPKEATAKRELPSSREEHEAAATTFLVGGQDIQRRRLLRWLAAGGASLFGAMVISLLRSLGASPDQALYSTVWKRGQRLTTLDGKPVSLNALTPGSTTIVFPEDSIGSEKTQTVLVKVDPALLRLPRDRAGWAPLGNLAFSRVCTHAGCSVGMYEATTHQLMCPCHQSTFDVLRGAEPSSGPAARPLPQLPLYADSEGNLRAASGFNEPPGPGFWGMPS